MAKRRLAAPSLSLTLSHGDSHERSHDDFSAAALSATPDDLPSLDINLEALETPSDSETGTLPDSSHELEWDGERVWVCVDGPARAGTSCRVTCLCQMTSLERQGEGPRAWLPARWTNQRV